MSELKDVLLGSAEEYKKTALCVGSTKSGWVVPTKGNVIKCPVIL